MASNTPNLVLRKPDGVDLVNPVTDLGANYDKIDAYMGSNISKRPRCRVSRATVLSIPNGGSSVSLVTREYDTSPGQTMWTAGVPYKLVAPVAGTYHVAFNAYWDLSGAGGARMFYLIKHPVNIIVAMMHTVMNGSWYMGGVVSTEIQLAAAEWVEPWAYQNSGAASNLSNVYSIWAEMHLLALT